MATSAGATIAVRVLAFALVRETLGAGERVLTLPAGATVGDLRDRLAAEAPGLAPLRAATRAARAGALVDDGVPLADGDEIALLPPVGGG